jgi:hypothetical protein
LRERSSSFNNSKDREMCIINNRSRSSVNERKKNLRGEEKGEGEGERELVRCGFCLGREGENGGGERVIKEGIKREHSTLHFIES